ncbi:MAG: class II fructose-bisphosphate aldolase [Proteobacteria bacterium]|nr:class II fructose-bisphosphate aldolase [Pseudomonadota bacterium]
MKNHPIIVHSLEDAEAALAAAADLGVPVTLRSAPGAARYLGATVFRDMISEAAKPYSGLSVTAVFDCGSDPGLALGALRHGLKAIRVDIAADVLGKITDIAAQSGARVEFDDEQEGAGKTALDLLDLDDPEAAVRTWLREGK